MKKLLVMAALATLVATSAFAASGVITGSAHDLSGYSTNTNELCVYCHTPHGGTNNAPLWNRGLADMSGYNVFDSATLNATPTLTVGDTQLCMSCHDGAMNDTLINPPAGGSPDFVALNATFSTAANIGDDDLTNDHPVGFTYDTTLATADGELHNPATVPAVAALLFTGEMWCSSCHDVHKPGTVALSDIPFLRATNDGSALCLTCHNK